MPTRRRKFVYFADTIKTLQNRVRQLNLYFTEANNIIEDQTILISTLTDLINLHKKQISALEGKLLIDVFEKISTTEDSNFAQRRN